MSKKQLQDLRRKHADEVSELKALMKENEASGLTAINCLPKNKIAELEFQIKMIDKLL